MGGGRTFMTMAGAALLATNVNAACTGPLLIDDFSLFNIHTNKLGDWTDDDQTMQSISASGGTVTFTPKNDSTSYFYETLGCQTSYTDGYTGFSFSFKGPAGGSFALELQTAADCNSTTTISSYVGLGDLTGETQTLSAPFSPFVRSNLDTNVDAIQALIFSDFTGDGAWQLGKLQFVCGDGTPAPTTTAEPPPETTSSDAEDPPAPTEEPPEPTEDPSTAVATTAEPTAAPSATTVSTVIAPATSTSLVISATRETRSDRPTRSERAAPEATALKAEKLSV